MEHLNYSEEWFIWEQNASPMLLIMTLNPAFNDLRDYLGSCFFNSLVIFEHDAKNNYQGRWYYRLDEERILGQKMLDMLLCPSYMFSFNSGIQLAEKKLMARAREIWGSYESISLDKAVDSFEDFLHLYYDYYKRAWFCEPVQRHIEFLISGYLNKNYKGEEALLDATQSLFATEDDSFTVAIIRDLLECAKVIDKLIKNDITFRELVLATPRNPDYQSLVINHVFLSGREKYSVLLKKLQEHSNKYHWKKNNYFTTTYVSPEDLLFELIDDSHIKSDSISLYYSNMLVMVAEAKVKQLDVKTKVFAELPNYYKNLISISSLLGSSMRDDRKRNIMECNSVFDALLGVVSKETGVSLSDIHMLIPQELRNFIDTPDAYLERFNERRKLFICFQSDFPLIDELIDDIDISSDENALSWHIRPMDELYIAEGMVAERKLSELNSRMNLFASFDERDNGLQGIVIFRDSSKDVIEGVVHIIRNPKSEHLQEGEILVAPTTTPDYSNDIYKCKAIITDWSGQTSHAAIISRELKKPCIIGTGYATHFLKTGQKVKIDFSKGSIEVVKDGGVK